MPEPITFDPLGTITVTFEDGTEVTIGRPKFGQWRWFTNNLNGIFQQLQDRIAAATAKVETAKGDKAKAAAQAERDDLAAQPLYESTIPWMAEVFKQLGDQPVPEPDEWPAWLAADTNLPVQILAHWRTAPKASGRTNPS